MKRFVLLIAALFCASAFADELPRIAVYVTGNVGDDEKKALGTRMLATLINSKRYKGIERSNSFLAEIEREQERQRNGEIDDSQISQLGRQCRNRRRPPPSPKRKPNRRNLNRSQSRKKTKSARGAAYCWRRTPAAG